MDAMMERDAFFETLYRDWYDTIRRQCYRFIGYDPARSHAVKDCLQEAILRAYLQYDMLSQHPNAIGWLINTCKHLLLNESKKVKRRQHNVSLDADDVPFPADPNDAVTNWLASEDIHDIVTAINEVLTEKEAEVFREFFLNERTQKETGRVLGTSDVAIGSTVFRIRKKISHLFIILFHFILIKAQCF